MTQLYHIKNTFLYALFILMIATILLALLWYVKDMLLPVDYQFGSEIIIVFYAFAFFGIYQVSSLIFEYYKKNIQKIVYFKFHPRDDNIVKSKLKNKITTENIYFIDTLQITDFVELYRPQYAYSVFSDSLFKLHRQGLTTIFLYNRSHVLKKHAVIRNIDAVLHLINDSRLSVEKT